MPFLSSLLPLFQTKSKGPGKQGHIVADTLLPTEMFPRLSTNFVSGTQRMFLILFRNIVSATNVSQFAQPKKHHGQQCVLVYQGLKCKTFLMKMTLICMKMKLHAELIFI